MSIIEMGEKLAKDLDERIDRTIISAVLYGEDIHSELKEGADCHMLLVLDKVDLPTVDIIYTTMKENARGCMKLPLVIEMEEIEGMMDSVPPTFLNILISYQTVYGKSLFKGLSSINHEHLRAQTEQSLREDLFTARLSIMKGLSNSLELVREVEKMRDTLWKSIKLFYILKKPWLTEEEERWQAFFDDFGISDIWIQKYYNKDLTNLSDDDLKKLGMGVIDSGIKPILRRVDELGPG